MEKYKTLMKKINIEYGKFSKEMLSKSSKEVFDNAYKIDRMYDIKCHIENTQLSEATVSSLLNHDYPLETLYSNWLDMDIDNSAYDDLMWNYKLRYIDENEQSHDMEDDSMNADNFELEL